VLLNLEIKKKFIIKNLKFAKKTNIKYSKTKLINKYFLNIKKLEKKEILR
jgi:hypothetical protein